MPRIIYRFPFSFIFFAMTVLLFLLQLFPYTGIFLMFLAAAFWSVPLINAGMVGTAIEAMVGRRVSRWWLVLPVTFYGVYVVLAIDQHAKLQHLTASNDAANASVSIGFDPLGQALVVEGEGIHTKLVQNYELPVAYVENSHFTEGYQSYRMIDMAICQKVGASKPAFASSIYAPIIKDGDGLGKWEKRFCGLSMPEAPQLPVVRVSQKTTNTTEGLLTVSRTVTTVTMPDRSQFRLVGGFASPLSWLPRLIMGCFLNDAKASWDCDAGFMRERRTPIVSGSGQFGGDTAVLARALGLKPIAIADRHGAAPSLVLDRIAALEDSTLARQLAELDAMIADPVTQSKHMQTEAITSHPEVFASRADAIMSGLGPVDKGIHKSPWF